MTHSNLLRVCSYLGFRVSRKNPGTNSIAVCPSLVAVVASQCRIQPLDHRSFQWRSRHHANRDSRHPLVVAALRGACLSMGQARSFVRGYSGTGENANRETSGEETDSANASNDVNGSVESQDERQASAEKLANIESNPEAVVSPKQGLQSQVEKRVEMGDRESNKPAETEAANNEMEEKAQIVLDLESELGEPPERPFPGDCCGQGCDVCVWDTYNDELRDYLARQKSLLAKTK